MTMPPLRCLAGLLAIALLFVWRSFYAMRIPKEI